MTDEERAFLIALRDGEDIYPLVKRIGYGWAMQRGWIRRLAPEPMLDFALTGDGRAALSKDKIDG